MTLSCATALSVLGLLVPSPWSSPPAEPGATAARVVVDDQVSPQEEVLPDGRRVRCARVESPDGPVLDGKYQVLSAAGDVLVEGEYKAGQRSGRWTFMGPSGSKAARGKYKDGRRVGDWTFWRQDGTKRASGKFSKGAHAGKWKGFTEAGKPDASRSGRLEWFQWSSRVSQVGVSGYLLQGEFHGRWTVTWPDGSTCLTALFEAGECVGHSPLLSPTGAPLSFLVRSPDVPMWGDPMFDDPTPLGQFELGTSEVTGDLAEALDRMSSWAPFEGELSAGLDVGEFESAEFTTRALDADSVRDAWALGLRALRGAGAAAPDLVSPNVIRKGGVNGTFGRLLSSDSSPYGLIEDDPTTFLLHAATDWMLRAEAPAFWGFEARVRPFKRIPVGAREPLVGRTQMRWLFGTILGEAAPGAGSTGREDAGPLAALEGSTREAALDGLSWLINHQDADGGWDPVEFMEHDPVSDRTDGVGQSVHKVGVTGLAMLTLLRSGSTPSVGPASEAIQKAAAWIVGQQNPKTGLFGPAVGHAHHYDHAISMLALAECLESTRSPVLRNAVTQGAKYLLGAQAEKGGWGYEPAPTDRCDTCLTGWAIRALAAAQVAGCEVEFIGAEAGLRAIEFLDDMTEAGTGRSGYVEAGTPSARVPGVNDHFPIGFSEGLTASVLLSRLVSGQTPGDSSIMKTQLELVMAIEPEWDPEGLSVDLYFWMLSSDVLRRSPSRGGDAWLKGLARELVKGQRGDGAAKGSWDPAGAWSPFGGRIFSTAAALFCLLPEPPDRG